MKSTSGTSSAIRSTRRALPVFRDELKALLGNTSLSVKCICVTVICSYLLSYYQPAVEYLSVIPGHLLPPSFWVWTLFTHPFLEIHLWEVVVDLITVGLCGKLIEPLWGTKEMLIFFGIVNFAVVFLSVSYYLFLYAVTFDPSMLFEVKIHGLSGYLAATSVCVRQIMPDHVLLRTPMGKLTNRNVPLTVLFVSIIVWAVGLLEGSYCTMFASGILSSWIYLRFYQKHANGSRGDSTDFFTFASFFPNVLQPIIAVLANSIFGFFVKLGCCQKQVKRFVEASGPSAIRISVKSDAERRKQKALRLLSERLGTGGDESNAPLLRPESDEEDSVSISIPSSSMTRSLSAGGALPAMDSSSQSTSTTGHNKGDVIIPV